jgi:hypothetical protein
MWMKLKMAVSRGLLVLVAAVGLAVATTSAASASPPNDETHCFVSSGITSCWTHVIHANNTYHKIHYEACSPEKWTADWQIKDASNGVIVKQGHLNWKSCVVGNVYGLYGNYHAWIFNTRSGAQILINNYN